MLNWLDKSDNEILSYLKKEYDTPDLIFIGQYLSHNGAIRFVNVRTKDYFSLNFLGNEELNTKLKGKKLWVYIHKEIPELTVGIYYQFKAKLSSKQIREKYQNPFALQIDETYFPIEYNPIPKEFIERRFAIAESTHFANNQQLAKALNSIQREINKSPETFIFELLQNASDYPDRARENKVFVSFKISENYLLFCHSGAEFKVNNVHSICSVNESDKVDAIDKIGFKGIGFKSVFKDCNLAYIKSGGYSFRFDSSKFITEKPYQIIPVWTEPTQMEAEVVETTIFKNSTVSIALKPRRKEKLQEYHSILTRLFTDDRILLFLPNIENAKIITPTGFKESKKKLLNYWIGKEQVTIPDNIREWINKEIDDNESVVPEKYYDIQNSVIKFATSRTSNQIALTSNSVLYNYLPTKVNLGFDFLINGDFIPDGTREFFHNIKWNDFLIEQSGFLFLKWIKSIGEKKDERSSSNHKFKRDYLKIIPDFSIIETQVIDERNKHLLSSFKQGFDLALIGNEENQSIAFIPTESNNLVTLSNILIDETGLAKLIREDFSKLTGITGKLINSEVGEGKEKIKALITEYEQGIIYEIENLKADLKKIEFQEWLKTPLNNYKLIQYISSKKELKSLLDSEEIVLTESGELSKAEEIYSSIPDEVAFIPNKKLNTKLKEQFEKSNIELKTKKFNATDFLISNKENINQLLTTEEKIISFWSFIYDNWKVFKENDEVKKSLRSFSTLCKPIKTDELNIKQVSATYLCKEMAVEDEVETIIESLNLKDKFFINPVFITKENRDQPATWTEIFSGAKRGLLDLISELIQQLSDIEDALHFKACNEIFKYWNRNKEKPEKQLTTVQIATLKKSLKIKCIDTEYRKTSNCFISDHYNNNQLIASWLPIIELPNQVAQEYAPRTNQVTEWKNFLLLIGCVELQDKENVFDAKINYLIENQRDLRENHFNILQAISQLFKDKKANNFSFERLSEFLLKSNTNEWLLPNQIHFSSLYKPRLDLQNDVDLSNGINFLNFEYTPQTISYSFLNKIGVHSNFEFKLIEAFEYDKFENKTIKNTLFNGEKFKTRKQYLLNRRYEITQIQKYTKFENHILCYPYLTTELIQKYNKLFFDVIFSLDDKYFKQTSLKNNGNTYDSCDNELISFIKENETIENKEGLFVKPTTMFSTKLVHYIDNVAILPKNDYSEYFKSDNSIEKLIGIQQELSSNLCIRLLCGGKENKISINELGELNFAKILSGYTPNDEEKKQLCLLNSNNEWKPLNELFISTDEHLQITHSQLLHEYFHSLAANFGIPELSEGNLVLKIVPETPIETNEIELFFRNKAKYVAFKIDHLNHEEVEAAIVEKITQINFYEVTSIAKIFPEKAPIYTTEIDFHFNKDENKIFHKDNWKTNKSVIDFIFQLVQNDKIERVWFENLINRWDDNQVIEFLEGEFGTTPFATNAKNIDSRNETIEDNIWEDISEVDEKFIKGIIKGDFELNEKLDANTTAKIKTLMEIRHNYSSCEISDEGRFLKAGSDEILVRSAQNGLLYLDLYHWDRLSENSVKLAVYTMSQIKIYDSQDDLIRFTKPQNKFGILRMPDDYNVEDYNSLGYIKDKGKWHYVFIVNENTKAAQQYKEIIDLDEYNFG